MHRALRQVTEEWKEQDRRYVERLADAERVLAELEAKDTP
jgi:hypothetical protein